MKFSILSFFVLALFMTSCSDDPLSEKIVGTWELQSAEVTGCDDASENIPLTTVDDNNCITLYGDTACNFFFTFASGGTATQTLTLDNETEIEDFTYTINDDNDTMLLCASSSDCYTVRVDGDSFALTFNDGSCMSSLVFEKA